TTKHLSSCKNSTLLMLNSHLVVAPATSGEAWRTSLTHKHTHGHTHTYAHAHTSTHKDTHTQMHTHTQTHTQTHSHIHRVHPGSPTVLRWLFLFLWYSGILSYPVLLSLTQDQTSSC